MAHEKVERRSISNKEWSKLVFQRIKELIYLDNRKINNWFVREGVYTPGGYIWDDPQFISIQEGELWGGPDTTAVFKCEVTIPKEYDGKRVYFYMLAACEVMVKLNGSYLGGIDPNRDRFVLTENAVAGEIYELELEAYTRSKPDDDRSLSVKRMKGCVHPFVLPELILIDEEMLSLSYDLQVLYESTYSELMDESVKDYLNRHISNILSLLPSYDSSTEAYKNAVPLVKKYLADHVYKNEHSFGKNGKLACVAYSHLDIAYHWKVAQTVQKNARTVLIQLRLMDKYKDFTYAHTQAWTYEMLEKYYPELFEQVKAKVKSGQWEIMGGLYVEPDCNLISAESYVRQIVYGKNYFLDKFNIEVDNCWLPDVFGNSPIMPQILKKGGIDYFVSNKMSTWNDTNKFPYNNFIWRGIDDSEVFACVPPTHFISWAEPDQAIGHWEAFQNKDICDESLQMYGYGDGGSGVTEEMLEFYHRQEMLPYIPKQRLTTGKEYLHSIFVDQEKFPVWEGDLYLEMHRGTFTTKGNMKLANRKGEFRLSETELYAVISNVVNGGTSLTINKTRDTWKKLLLNQFHDIIPGSHTTAVANEAMDLYNEISDDLVGFHDIAFSELIRENDSNSLTLLNTVGIDRKGIAYIHGEQVHSNLTGYELNGGIYYAQNQVGPNGVLRTAIETPILSKTAARTVQLKKIVSVETKMKITESSMENDFYIVEIDEMGQLTRIFDKTVEKELIHEGSVANEWQMFDDCPGVYNAWDIVDNYSYYPVKLEGIVVKEIVEDGQVSIAIKVTRMFNSSKYIQIIRLFRNHRRIDFETWVDWHEDQKLLKVAFPLSIKGTEYRVDTSAGVLSHVNNKNTSWQQAKFEVPCHKWVEMSAGHLGVALLNDSKYGCDVNGHVMRLSLLRAPIRPDRHSDRGEHQFTYSLLTHDGQWQRSQLIEEAYNVNWPIQACYGNMKHTHECFSLIDTSNNEVIIQSVKLAEDGSKDIVVRLTEVKQTYGTVAIKPNFDFKKVFLCDLLERRISDVNLGNVTYHPYEIITLRFVR